MSTSAITKLPQVHRSPTSFQYVDYKHRLRKPKPFYKPRFTFKTEDRKHTLFKHEIRETDPLMPLYPYGSNQTFPEANWGLYGGSTIQSGNKISRGRNKGKTLRQWFPNVRIEKVWSEALHRELKLPITARVMRTIRKCGGLDQYVTGSKPARIKELGILGWKLRWLVMTSPKWLERHAEQMRKHKLPQEYSLTATFEDVWNNDEKRTKLIEQQELAWQDLRDAAQRFEAHVQRNWVGNGERQNYIVPKMETLRSRGPAALDLPEYLEAPDVVPIVMPLRSRSDEVTK